MEDIWDVQSDREWNEFLLKSVIKGTGFPANYIDSSNDVDFARTVIMQNQLLVRKVVSDQETFSEIMTKLIKKIYQYEYESIRTEGMTSEQINTLDDNIKEDISILEEIVNNLEVKYNPPVTLNLNNINDQINNANQTLDFVVNSYFDDQDDSEESKKIKIKFKRKAVEKLVPGLDFSEFDELFNISKLEAKSEILLDRTLKKDDDMYDDEFGGGYDSGSSGGGMDFGGGNGSNQAPQDFNQQTPDLTAQPDFNQQAPADVDGNPMTGMDDMSNNGMGL